MKRMKNEEMEREIGERFEIEKLPDGRVRICGLVWKVNDLVEKGPMEEIVDVQGRQSIDRPKLVEYPVDDGNFGGEPLFGRSKEQQKRIEQNYEDYRYQAIFKQAPEGATAFEVLRRHPDPEFLHNLGIPLRVIALTPYNCDLIRYY